jgi:prophage regulatory protein
MFTPQIVQDANASYTHGAHATNLVQRDRLIRLPEVLRVVGVGKSTWYALIQANKAPKGVSITPRCVAWSESACLAWVQARLDEAQQGGNQ